LPERADACFFLLAGPARKTVRLQLAIILPGSSPIMNYLRTFRTFYNFVWTLTDAAIFRPLRAPLTYELKGENFLDELAPRGPCDRWYAFTPTFGVIGVMD